MADLIVTRVGAQALLEDRGRRGLAHLGVPPSGAADRRSLAQGNRLLGNDDDAAGIEVLLGGLHVRASGTVTVAVTGAPAPVTVAGQAAGFGTVLRLDAGQELALGRPATGLRSYLAVRGGVGAPPGGIGAQLGSLSSDPTSGLGPAPLTVGSRLPIGRTTGMLRADLTIPPAAPPVQVVDLPGLLGPRDAWLTSAALRLLHGATWSVSAEADRVGVRLHGPALDLARTDQLPSEGLVRGAVQVPPSGQPVIFLADHPTTGGYPVVAVVDDPATDGLAQLRPGTRVRFTLQRAGWR